MQTVFSLDDGGTAAAVAALASAALQAASKIDATPTQGVALGLGRAARWASNRRPLMRGRTIDPVSDATIDPVSDGCTPRGFNPRRISRHRRSDIAVGISGTPPGMSPCGGAQPDPGCIVSL